MSKPYLRREQYTGRKIIDHRRYLAICPPPGEHSYKRRYFAHLEARFPDHPWVQRFPANFKTMTKAERQQHRRDHSAYEARWFEKNRAEWDADLDEWCGVNAP
jgi:phosphatidylethanolamine-binding protein (PEBP) family uncharacterized protein